MTKLVRLLVSSLVVLFIGWAIEAAAATADEKYQVLGEEFDARPLTADEKRFLQTALAFQGYYSGLLDGIWGRASQAAIERYAQDKFSGEPRNINIATLVIDFLTNVESQGWAIQRIHDASLSLALPMKGLLPPFRDASGVSWRHIANGVEVAVLRQFESGRDETHELILSASIAGDEPYVFRDNHRWITSSKSRNDGRLHYARSDYLRFGWSTVTIIADEAAASVLSTIAASIAALDAPDWTLPPSGRVNAIVDLARAYAREQTLEKEKAEQSNADSNENPDWVGSGTGFYINNSGMVLTDAHVVLNCGMVKVGFREMETVAADADIDLAVLQPRGSDADRQVSDSGAKEGEGGSGGDAGPVPGIARFAVRPVALNADVTAAGFPLPEVLSGINVTRGVVSGLKGLRGNIEHFQISAEIQQGNSGGPVLDETGAVVGVVVAKLDALKVSELSGDLPQNVNFAIRGDIAKAFLTANDIPFYLAENETPIANATVGQTAEKITVFVECFR